MLLKRELESIRSNNNNNSSGTIEGAGGSMGGAAGKGSHSVMEVEELNRELATLKARNESLEMELVNQQTKQLKMNTNSKDNNMQNVNRVVNNNNSPLLTIFLQLNSLADDEVERIECAVCKTFNGTDGRSEGHGEHNSPNEKYLRNRA